MYMLSSKYYALISDQVNLSPLFLNSAFPFCCPDGVVGRIFSTTGVSRSSWQSGMWSPSAGPCWLTAWSITVEMTKSKASCGTWSPPLRTGAPRSCKITWVSPAFQPTFNWTLLQQIVARGEVKTKWDLGNYSISYTAPITLNLLFL